MGIEDAMLGGCNEPSVGIGLCPAPSGGEQRSYVELTCGVRVGAFLSAAIVSSVIQKGKNLQRPVKMGLAV